MTYFYARVSTKEQNLDRQLETAKEFKSIDRIFADKQSGKTFNRKAYNEMKSILVPGDEVIVKELDRLGRNKDAVKEEVGWFKENGIVLRILDVPTTLLDFKGQDWIQELVNNILIEVLSSIAEQERNKTIVRQREGIDAMAIVNGKHFSASKQNFMGRPAKQIDGFDEMVERYRAGAATVAECCRQLGISRQTWYNKTKKIA